MGDKHTWTNEQKKCLLQTCIEEVQTGHPKAASLKTVPLVFPELCAELFDGNSASGNRSYATSQTPSGHGLSSFHVAPLQLMDAPSINIDEDDFFSSHTQPPSSAASPSVDSPFVTPTKGLNPQLQDLELLVPHLIHLLVPRLKFLLMMMI
ncbi:unnamed protein product [Lactuca saligna]|uniref:Uncharacterized protein n=1 Tax=Lactuca saligna TaxID=75948 RepID=A0AA36ERZ3_LACSI|nr:unnamed protein product [Lactuca saligna]